MILVTIGRNPDSKIIINDSSKKVSSQHAEIKISDNGSISILDKSMNGTTVNGRNINPNQEITIRRGDDIVFANVARLDWNQVPNITTNPNIIHSISVGKNFDNNIKINHEKISRYHSIVKVDKKGKVFIYDQSLNGTYVNGSPIPKYTDFEIKRNSNVSFANVSNLNWSEIPKISIGIAKIIIPLLIGGLIGVGFVFRDKLVNIFNNTPITETYSKSVGLIVNEFYYVQLNAKGDTTFIIGQDGVADFQISHDYSSIKPFAITGTGFAISEDGKIITNRHVATPWEDEEYKKQITARTQIRQLQNLDFANMLASETRGFSINVGIIPNDAEIDLSNYKDKLVPLKLVDVEQKKEIDLALMQVVSKTLPQSFTFVSADKIIKDQSEIKVDDDITIIGFPVGFDLAMKNKDSKVKSTSTHGKVSKISDKYEIQFDAASIGGASGAPIFNKTGELIAVNYAGLRATQGYNFGIIATHVKDLIK